MNALAQIRQRILPAMTALVLASSTSSLQAQEAPREGVTVGGPSSFRKLVPAETMEKQANQQYQQLLQQAASAGALAPENNPELQRLRGIMQRLLPITYQWNERARQWKWEVNLIGKKDINAFCMPGGKIAFYTGILRILNLTDDEVAMIMGHEIAHALREHARERAGKSFGLQAGATIVSQLLGLGDLGQAVVGQGAQLWMLKFSRDDEIEADIVGLDLAARAGFDPRAGVALWQKMAQAAGGAPPQWLSTHPAGQNRIKEIESRLPQVLPLYARAIGKTVAQLPPYQTRAIDKTAMQK